MVDTVRTVDELLNSLFASGQLPGSINEQDVRDMIVSISLETTDLSSLPRAPDGLPVGSLWIDNSTTLRVVTTFIPANIVAFVSMRGSGSVFAQGLKPGTQIWPASAVLNGQGTPTFNGTLRPSNLASGQPAGVGNLIATPMISRANVVGLVGVGGFAAVARQRMRASRTIGGVGSLIANATRTSSSPKAWAANPHIELLNAALTARNDYAYDLGGGFQAGTTVNAFKTSGKWYVELAFGARSGETRYGIANPSWDTETILGEGTTNWGVSDVWDGTGIDYYDGGTIFDWHAMAPPQEDGVVSVALDCDNWKWWNRLNGGDWAPWNGAEQNPATATGGMDIPTGLRSGGLSIACCMDHGEDSVDLLPTAAQWIYSPPSGFVAM